MFISPEWTSNIWFYHHLTSPSWFSLPQNPGHLHLVQPDHHSADAVQHLRLPGRPGGFAAGALQSNADVLGSLPDLQHCAALVAHGERLFKRGAAALTRTLRSWFVLNTNTHRNQSENTLSFIPIGSETMWWITSYNQTLFTLVHLFENVFPVVSRESKLFVHIYRTFAG